jgi:hypothetical protein
MAAVIRVKLRRDARTEDGQLIHAAAEDLDLDSLTPRARALAEALHDTLRHTSPGGTSLDIVCESELTNTEQADQNPRVPDTYRPVKNPDAKATRTTRWGPLLSAASGTTLVQWLEVQARDIPEGWYPIGAPHRPRVPSWEAGAADYYLTRDQAMVRAGLGATAWDTLIRTPLLTPDRYVSGRPQWLPESIDAFARRERELWPLSRVAEHLGLTPGSARVQMRRWGFAAESRGPGRGGENLYAADLVQAAHQHRPGRGRRTDLTEPPY